MKLPTLLLTAIMLAGAADAAADSSRARIWASQRNATTEGTVELGAPPVTVYMVATDYERWPYLFTDVSWATVKSGGREDASVRFASRALGHAATIKFDNASRRVVRFRLADGPPGARAWGEYVLAPSADGKRTIVLATLYMDAVGVVGWFVTDKNIRGKRERKLRSDLEDLARRFPVNP